MATIGLVKRRKPRSQRKGEMLRVRLTSEQKELFVSSAAQAGLEVSSWLRSIGVREAMAMRAGGLTRSNEKT